MSEVDAMQQLDSEPLIETTPRVWIGSLVFSDGSSVEFRKDDFILVVGPNNAGKSAALRAIRDRLFSNNNSLVIKEVVLGKEGDGASVSEWLRRSYRPNDPLASDPVYSSHGHGVHMSQVPSLWSKLATLGGLARFFCHLLTADERLGAANPAQSIAIAREPPSHPAHYLLRDDALELRLSKQFEKAFGAELVLNRMGGSQIPLHVGKRPTPKPGDDRISLDYIQEVEKLPQLHTQGDGMRSFAGVLLYTSVGRESLLLIDEPEAFLHPPQAKQLGRLLVEDKPAERQVFVATHSGDILRGVLDAGSTNVRVLRIQREGNVNKISQLDNDKVAELWGDPLLRYSNVLDGLFHERVIVCESDADARFYSAVTEAIALDGGEKRRADLMFTHCGGKDRIAVVVRALHALSVPVNVVVDFDALNAERPLRDIWEATGGDWSDIAPDFQEVKSSIDGKKPELASEEVAREVGKILGAVVEAVFPKDAKDGIQKILRRASPWATAKSAGKSFIPSGQPTQAFDRLQSALRRRGVFVVEVGELESFVRSVGRHGPKWVNEVIKRDLASDSELEVARRFVAEIIS
jgi:hypothetical protein